MAVIEYSCAGPLTNPYTIFAILELNKPSLSILQLSSLQSVYIQTQTKTQNKISASWDKTKEFQEVEFSNNINYSLCLQKHKNKICA